MGCWKKAAKNQFDGWSASYDRSILQKFFFDPSHDLLIDVADISSSAKVLDVGCGTGRFARRLLQSSPRATMTGLDLSEGMLKKAEANCADVRDRIDFIQGDAEHLPFEDKSFDIVTCIHSFHHYPNQEAAIKEMYRVLGPNGQLLILDADRDRWWGWFIYECIVKMVEGMIHHCSAARFQLLYNSVGFDSVKQVRGGWIAPFLITKGIALKSDSRHSAADAA